MMNKQKLFDKYSQHKMLHDQVIQRKEQMDIYAKCLSSIIHARFTTMPTNINSLHLLSANTRCCGTTVNCSQPQTDNSVMFGMTFAARGQLPAD